MINVEEQETLQEILAPVSLPNEEFYSSTGNLDRKHWKLWKLRSEILETLETLET
jgi:hypothetical protein